MTVSTPSSPLPSVRSTEHAPQFVVDGQATLLLGGQLHNSAASDPEHMRRALDHLADMHVGTVIGSASWAQLEPVEGAFEFSHVDAQIAAAWDHGVAWCSSGSARSRTLRRRTHRDGCGPTWSGSPEQ